MLMMGSVISESHKVNKVYQAIHHKGLMQLEEHVESIFHWSGAVENDGHLGK